MLGGMTTLSERLQKARRSAGYRTATDAARAFGWNENTYRSAENGSRPPSKTNIITYAKAYGVTVDWLMTGRGTPKGRQSNLHQIPILRSDRIGRTNRNNLAAFLAAAEIKDYVVMPEGSIPAHAIGIDIDDDAMVHPNGGPQSLFKRDTAFIDYKLNAKYGDIVGANYRERLIVRQLVAGTETDDGTPLTVGLKPLNPNHALRSVPYEQVWGPVCGMLRAFLVST